MANPQIEQLTQALFWKAVPWIVLCSAIGTFGRLAMNWLDRKAKGAGRSSRVKPEAGTSTTRRIFVPSSPPPIPPPSTRPPLPAPPRPRC